MSVGAVLCGVGIAFALAGVVASLRAQDAPDAALSQRWRVAAIAFFLATVVSSAAGFTLLLTQGRTP